MRVYEVGKESNQVDFKDYEWWDEFLPYVALNADKFKADYENSEEPTSTEGIELSEGIKKSVIEDKDNRVYTIKNDLEEIKIPFIVKKGLITRFLILMVE